MKKNVYLTILTIITVFCIIFGSVYHILGWGFSFLDVLFDLPHFSFDKDSAGPLSDSGEIELDDFTSIDADVYVMDLTIESADRASISFSGHSKLKPKYEVKNGTLFLTQNNFRNMWGSKKCSVTITVPEDQYCDRFDIQMDVGNIDIMDTDGETLELSADVGDIDITGCSFHNMDIQSDVGDIDVDNCDFLAVNIDCSVGDICVNSAAGLSDYYIDLSTSFGDVEYNGREYHRSYSQNGSVNGQEVVISNDTGDVELSDR